MLIELNNVFENDGARLPLDMDIDFSDVLDGGVCRFQTPVKLEGGFTNRIGMVSMDAVARFTYSAPCDRCAEQVTHDFVIPIHHNIVAQLSNEADNDYFLVAENMRLDVDDLIHSDVLLNMPAKFLCTEDCKGLCSKCGANLNNGPCGCKKEADPRMAKLLELIDSEETDS